MNILMISPPSPPKNTPESMQVGRYLEELDKEHHITLVNTPANGGWSVEDSSLEVPLKNTHIVTIRLWFHKFTIRLLHSRLFKHFLIPDQTAWIRYMTSYVLKKSTIKPDIIYSRSVPFSAALLAKSLKEKLQIPWVMHLSDPWFDSPYRQKTKDENKLANYELSCFENADTIMVTTKSVAEFYREKYPKCAHKILVSSNVLPLTIKEKNNLNKEKHGKLTLIYAGTMYGKRRATTILKGLSWLKENDEKSLRSIHIILIGNMTEEIKDEINSYDFEQIILMGKMNYDDVVKMQGTADILISIEPDGDNPLLKTFMPSKVLDYMASKKPILAVTPKNSETWKLCDKGYGWRIEPHDDSGLGKLLVELSKKYMRNESLLPVLEPLEEYTVSYNVEKLIKNMKILISENKKKLKEL